MTDGPCFLLFRLSYPSSYHPSSNHRPDSQSQLSSSTSFKPTLPSPPSSPTPNSSMLSSPPSNLIRAPPSSNSKSPSSRSLLQELQRLWLRGELKSSFSHIERTTRGLTRFSARISSCFIRLPEVFVILARAICWKERHHLLDGDEGDPGGSGISVMRALQPLRPAPSQRRQSGLPASDDSDSEEEEASPPKKALDWKRLGKSLSLLPSFEERLVATLSSDSLSFRLALPRPSSRLQLRLSSSTTSRHLPSPLLPLLRLALQRPRVPSRSSEVPAREGQAHQHRREGVGGGL